MRLLCDAKRFFESIGNGEDREAFLDEFGSPERFGGGILVSLFRKKSLRLNSLIWRDWSEVAKLLHTTKDTIYFMLLRNDDFLDVWTEVVNNKPRFRTLSELSNDDINALSFIEKYRDYLQGLVNKEYGEYVLIEWSGNKENEVII